VPKLILVAVGAVAAAVLAVAAVSGAGAQPRGETFVLDCGPDGEITVVVAGRGLWAPGHMVGGGVIIPTAFEFAGTVTVNGLVVEEFDEAFAKPHPRNQPQVVCTFGGIFEEDGAVITFEATVVAFIPRGHR
jgi:hypothetical protein